MDVTIPPEMEARAHVEADRHGVTVTQWWTAAAQAAAARAERIAQGLTDVEQMIAEAGGPDPAAEAEADAALERSSARLAARLAQHTASLPPDALRLRQRTPPTPLSLSSRPGPPLSCSPQTPAT